MRCVGEIFVYDIFEIRVVDGARSDGALSDVPEGTMRTVVWTTSKNTSADEER